MTESPLEYNFEDLFVGQKANFLKNQLTLFQKILDKEARPIGEMER